MGYLNPQFLNLKRTRPSPDRSNIERRKDLIVRCSRKSNLLLFWCIVSSGFTVKHLKEEQNNANRNVLDLWFGPTPYMREFIVLLKADKLNMNSIFLDQGHAGRGSFHKQHNCQFILYYPQKKYKIYFSRMCQIFIYFYVVLLDIAHECQRSIHFHPPHLACSSIQIVDTFQNWKSNPCMCSELTRGQLSLIFIAYYNNREFLLCQTVSEMCEDFKPVVSNIKNKLLSSNAL